MAEEFLESEVLFSDNHNHHHHNPPRATECDGCFEVVCSNNHHHKSMVKKMVANSMPVNIPERMLRWRDSGEEEEEDGEEGMVPPHVIVGRRVAGKMAYSVCTGNGRTLKGRDLSQVRNSILRMTGFLEA